MLVVDAASPFIKTDGLDGAVVSEVVVGSVMSPHPNKVMSVRKRRRGDGENGRKGEKRKKFLLPVKTD